jgi:hypothetical protein
MGRVRRHWLLFRLHALGKRGNASAKKRREGLQRKGNYASCPGHRGGAR